MKRRQTAQLTAVAVASAAVAVAANRLLVTPRAPRPAPNVSEQLAEAQKQLADLGKTRNGDFRQMQAALEQRSRGDIQVRNEEIVRLKRRYNANVGQRNSVIGQLRTNLAGGAHAAAAEAKLRAAEDRLQAAEARLQTAEANLQTAQEAATSARGGQHDALHLYGRLQAAHVALQKELSRVHAELASCEEREEVSIRSY